MFLEIFTRIVQGIGLTLWVTFASLAIGAVLGLFLLAAQRSRFKLLSGIASVYINVVRVIPPLTWLFLIYFGLPQMAIRFNPLQAAIFGFGIIASAFMAEIYRSGLLSIHKGQWEAAQALGMSSFNTNRYIVIPQAFRVAVAPIATYAIGLLKDSALASAIGVHEITFYAQQTAKQLYAGVEAFFVAGIFYILISLVLAVVSRQVDARLRKKIGLV